MIIVEKINGYNFYYYNENWQKPVITEQQIFQLFYKNKNIPTNFFAFPWASLYDSQLNNNAVNNLLTYKVQDKMCFTIIQHIHFRKYLELFKNIGITHIFTPHKQFDDIKLEDQFNIKIIALSLYPVQTNNNLTDNAIDIVSRKYVASFIGQYEDYYLTKIRDSIFNIFPQYNDCLVKRRSQWHYRDIVFFCVETNKDFENEYKNNLQETQFSLCPSGSGPNSIRIWESMSYGCIPVILADTLVLPEIKGIDYNDFFIIWKESEINKLYDYLKTINKETLINMSKKNIEMYNKYFSMDNMNKIIIEYFNC